MTKPLHKDGLMNILAIWHFSQKRYAAAQWSVVGRIILRLQVRTQFVTVRASGIKQIFHVSVLAVVNLTERSNSQNKNTNISLKNVNFEILTKSEKIKKRANFCWKTWRVIEQKNQSVGSTHSSTCLYAGLTPGISTL